jgi:DNA repair photolyase
VTNPPSPWQAVTVDWVGEAPEARLDVFEDRTRSILARNESPDLPFTWSVNPYRGCYHGCAYCYARPSHQYLDLGAGTDFERKLVVKPDAAALLREAFEAPAWKGEMVLFSGNTDCYQPLEASWGLTRACLEVCLAFRQPVAVITRSTLIERDLDLLEALHRESWLTVTVSVPFHDPVHARAIEPYAPAPKRRIETIARLAERGLRVGVNVAPIIPGLSDTDVPAILAAAREAGASFAGHSLVRLPGPVREVFESRLREALPDRADRVLHQIAACRDGRTNDPRFGHRMRGRGPVWEAIEALFRTTADRLGYGPHPDPPDPSTFRRPKEDRQLSLL